ncbi:MAG: acyltransferase [Oscillospiraceae bacterium]|nr:acyltransferase [Oscillospiraceae bacterium]
MDDIASKRSGISILRILATLSVIFLHTCSGMTAYPDRYGIPVGSALYTLLIIGRDISNWGVPCFLMITGRLLLDKDRKLSMDTMLTKYVKRIVLALFLFGVPFALMEIVSDHRDIRISYIPEAVIRTVTGQSWAHLWYLYGLIGLYLILPVLKAYTDVCEEKDLKMLLMVVGAAAFVLPYLNEIGLSVPVEVPLASQFVFYPLMGIYTERYALRIPKAAAAVVTVSCGAIIILMTVRDMPHAAALEKLIYIPMSVGLYLFTDGMDIHMTKALWTIDRLCFGAYLIHPLFINIMYKALDITPVSLTGNAAACAAVTVVFAVCFAAAAFASSFVMSLIPPLKRYVL